MSGKFRKFLFAQKLLFALLIVLVLVAIALHSRRALHFHDFSFAKLVLAIKAADIPLLLLSVVAIYGAYALRSVRWNSFCRHLGHTTFLRTYAGTLEGFAALFILGRAGDPVRPLLLARKDRLPTSSMFGIYVLERLFDFASYVGLFAASLLAFSPQLMSAGVDADWISSARHWAWILLGVLAAAVAGVIYFRLHGAGHLDRRLAHWCQGNPFRKRLAAMVGGFSHGLQAMRDIPDLLLALFYSAAHWALIALIYFMIVRAFGDPFSSMNFPGAMLLLSITLLGSILQLPGVGGGAQFASFIALTQIFGADPEASVVVAVVLWLITFSACTVTGIPLLVHEGWSIGELRRLARAESEAEQAGRHAEAKPSHAPPRAHSAGGEEASR
jgi:glycosyltransferase 2 family protein